METGVLSTAHRPDDLFPLRYVNTPEALAEATADLLCYDEVAFDAEGVRLGREGPLTIATFLGLSRRREDAVACVAYVIDVQVLGAKLVFPSGTPTSLRRLLEDPEIVKATFDCRGDSDALFHQFGVKLSGVLDLQVLDQGVRVARGEAPPNNSSAFVRCGGVPFLQGMAEVSKRYLDFEAIRALGIFRPGPHKQDAEVWAKRPLSTDALRYAANDVFTIREMLVSMRRQNLSEQVMAGVVEGSAKYVRLFRDRPDRVRIPRDRIFVMEERPIIQSDDLPSTHPRTPGEQCSYAKGVWDSAVYLLKGLRRAGVRSDTDAFNSVMFILEHRRWYTGRARSELWKLCLKYPFTRKQERRIRRVYNGWGEGYIDGNGELRGSGEWRWGHDERSYDERSYDEWVFGEWSNG